MSDSIIAVDRITKQVNDSSGPLTILHEVSFELQPQQSVAIVGASGSGKSTLLSIIAGLDTPSSGRVRLAGVDLFSLDEDARAAVRAAQVGFVFQSFQLLGNLSAIENVMLPLELQGQGDARVRAKEMLGRVGLGDRLNHYPRVLSGGEQQRVAIARALVNHPPVILADEPTAPLDSERALAVIRILNQMAQQYQTAIIVVTHDEKIIPTFKRIYQIRDGQTFEEAGEGRSL